jgi:hypothetical protein
VAKRLLQDCCLKIFDDLAEKTMEVLMDDCCVLKYFYDCLKDLNNFFTSVGKPTLSLIGSTDDLG